MSEQRKWLFGFFRNFGRSNAAVAEEVNQQADFAKPQAKEAQVMDRFAVALSELDPDHSDPVANEIVQFCQTRLSEILILAGMVSEVSVTSNLGVVALDIANLDDAGRIIGKDGATLDAFQTLLQTMVFQKFMVSIRVSLDSGGYRKKREEGIRQMVAKAISDLESQVRFSVRLRPMNATERRMVHTLLKGERGLRSFSVGDGHDRQVIIERRSSSPK